MVGLARIARGGLLRALALAGAGLLLLIAPAGLAQAATVTVTNVTDDTVTGNGVSLREAIASINAGANLNADVVATGTYGVGDTIAFNLQDTVNGVAGSGPYTILPLPAGLPTPAVPMTIDGFTQAGASANTNAFGGPSNAVLMIQLSGTAAGNGGRGLVITGPNVTVKGLSIQKFQFGGILLQGGGADHAVIQGCYIGTNTAGDAGLGNGSTGVFVNDAPNVTIGGTTAAARTVITAMANNNSNGVVIQGPGATNALVQGSYIGTNPAGTAALVNSTTPTPANVNGVLVTFAPDATIGGTVAGAGNVISGNTGIGVNISTAADAVIQGNLVGTNAAGTAAVANGTTGVNINGPRATVGGAVAGARNVVSGQTGTNHVGVVIGGPNATDAKVQGNYVGTDITGTTAIANQTGILVNSAPNATIGGTAAGAGNLVSGNAVAGVLVQSSPSTGAIVQGNVVGLNVTGSAALANGTYGIEIDTAPGATVGGPDPGARNVVAGNGIGIRVQNSIATNATIQGNYVGTNPAGATAIGNTSIGIDISDAPSVTIGGTATGAGNLVSGNGSVNISVTGGNATNAVIQGNVVGTNLSGTAVLGATTNGILIGAPGALVGGSGAGARNLVSGHFAGIFVLGGTAASDTIQGNYLGTNAAGTGPISNLIGIQAQSAPGLTIGGTTSGAGNLISGNGLAGIQMASGASGTIQGNLIGTDAAGTSALANGFGVDANGAVSVTVGGTASGVSNVIAFNSQEGIRVLSTATIRGNAIFSNGGLGIDISDDGVTANDAGDPDTGPNNRQNFPVLSSASVAGGSTSLAGTLNSTSSTGFDLDFFGSPTCDPLGNGEGKLFLGTTHVVTNSTGNASFAATGLATVPAGSAITATATSSAGFTSEFSACVTASAVGVTVDPLALALAEGGSSLTFTVALNSVPSSTVTITPVYDAGVLAVSPATRTFQANATALTPQTFTVSAPENATVDGTRSVPITFGASASDGQYNGISVDAITVTVTDNEGSAGLTIADVSATEPASATSPAQLMVTLGPATSQSVTVQYATANGTATGGAGCTGGVDFVASSGTLTFTAGQTTKPLSIAICADTVAELSEAFTVVLSSPTGGAILGAHPTATVTIANTGGQLAAGTPDSYSVAAGATLNVPAGSGVLANDGNIGLAGPLTAQAVTQPGHGSLSLGTDGAFTYTPSDGFAGTDSFTYRASDGTFQSPPATVTLTVTPTACVPRPRVATAPVTGGGKLSVHVDSTPLSTNGNNPLQQIQFTRLQNATVTLNGQTYTEGQNYHVPANIVGVDFTVARTTPGQASTVEFTVVDGCGSWNTFVGGGTSAGF